MIPLDAHLGIGGLPGCQIARYPTRLAQAAAKARFVIASPFMPADLKIDYIELPGNDFDALEAFYSSTFGWKFTDYGAHYRAFTDDKLGGGFYKSELKSSTAVGAALVVLYAKDLAETRDRVVAQGGSIVKDIFAFPGGRRFHFSDPHGNELAVWSDQ